MPPFLQLLKVIFRRLENELGCGVLRHLDNSARFILEIFWLASFPGDYGRLKNSEVLGRTMSAGCRIGELPGIFGFEGAV